MCKLGKYLKCSKCTFYIREFHVKYYHLKEFKLYKMLHEEIPCKITREMNYSVRELLIV